MEIDMAKTMKRLTVIAKAIQFTDGVASAVNFTFPDKTVRQVRLAELHALTYAHAAAHGIAQKVGDAAAMSKNPETGTSASIADKVAAATEVLDRITDASAYRWNAERTGGGGESYLFRALCRLYDGEHDKPAKTADEVKTWMGKWTEKQLRAMAVKNPTIAGLIAEIRLEAVEDEDCPDIDEGWDDEEEAE